MKMPPIEATGGFFLLLAWLNYIDNQGVVPLCVLACGLHELGHYLALRVLNIPVRRIRLTMVGAEMEISRSLSHGEEGAAALAGPGVSLLLALVFSHWDCSVTFAGINLCLGCFNMIPAGSLDGGRALHATLSLLIGPDTAHHFCLLTDRLFRFFLLSTGIGLLRFGGNMTFLLVSFWLFCRPILSKQGIRTCHSVWKRVKWSVHV